MADQATVDMAATITEKLTALDARFDESDAKMDARLAEYEASAETERKIRFAGDGDNRLKGSKFGRQGLNADDIEHLYMLTEAFKGLRVTGLDVGPGPSEDLRAAFADVSGARVVDGQAAEQADIRAVEELFDAGKLDKVGFRKALANARAMDTAETGYGLQLIGAQYANTLWAGANAESRLFSLIPQFTMTAPTAYLPVGAVPPVMSFVAEKTTSTIGEGYTTTKTGSNRVQVDANKFLIRQVWSEEMNEDSIIPFLPFLTEMAQRSIAQYSDWLVLNGDTTDSASNINDDGGALGGTEYFLAADGLRHVGLVDNTGNGVDQDNAAITWDALVNLRKKLLDATYFNDWGHPNNPADLVYVVNPSLGDDITKLDEVVTVDKYGSLATVLTGEVGHIGRNPLITTIGQELTESDGFVNNSPSQNRSTATLFNRNGFTVGMLRNLKVAAEPIIESDQAQIVYSMRFGIGRFTPTGAASGIEAAAVLYNIP